MVKLGTICNECVFYEDIGKECSVGKLKKFEEIGAEVVWETTGPVIDRVCLYRRPFSWAAHKTSAECEDQVKEEVYVKGTILLLAEDLGDLKKILDLLRGIKNINNFRLIINHSERISRESMESFTSDLDFDDFLCMLSFEEDMSRRTYDCFKKSKNGLFIILDCSKEVDGLFIDKLNHFLNEEMVKAAHIKPIDGNHLSVTSVIMYKHLYGDLEQPIAVKMADLDSGNMVFSWEDVNEKCKSLL